MDVSKLHDEQSKQVFDSLSSNRGFDSEDGVSLGSQDLSDDDEVAKQRLQEVLTLKAAAMRSDNLRKAADHLGCEF